MSLLIINLILFTVFAAVASQLIFKTWVTKLGSLPINAAGISDILVKILQSPLMMLGLLLYAAGFLAWIFLLSRASLSTVYPIILSANIVLIFAISSLFFNETANFWQVAGVGLIIAGIYLVFSA